MFGGRVNDRKDGEMPRLPPIQHPHSILQRRQPCAPLKTTGVSTADPILG